MDFGLPHCTARVKVAWRLARAGRYCFDGQTFQGSVPTRILSDYGSGELFGTIVDEGHNRRSLSASRYCRRNSA